MPPWLFFCLLDHPSGQNKENPKANRGDAQVVFTCRDIKLDARYRCHGAPRDQRCRSWSGHSGSTGGGGEAEQRRLWWEWAHRDGKRYGRCFVSTTPPQQAATATAQLSQTYFGSFSERAVVARAGALRLRSISLRPLPQLCIGIASTRLLLVSDSRKYS
jgi:hypothetical protein